MLLLMSHVLRHNLTGVVLQDLLTMFNEISLAWCQPPHIFFIKCMDSLIVSSSYKAIWDPVRQFQKIVLLVMLNLSVRETYGLGLTFFYLVYKPK